MTTAPSGETDLAGDGAKTWRQRLSSLLLARGHTSLYVARASGIGLFVSFSPTTGAQVPILIALRVLLARVWPFHLPLAIFWTLLTNVVTLPFIYYVYVVTGRLMLGRLDKVRGFDVFYERMQGALNGGGSWYERIWIALADLAYEFGLPLMVGWLPWAAVIALGGYWLTLKFHQRRHPEG